jgi:hypothetical protein
MAGILLANPSNKIILLHLQLRGYSSEKYYSWQDQVSMDIWDFRDLRLLLTFAKAQVAYTFIK